MAKTATIQREHKRTKLRNRYANKRRDLKEQLRVLASNPDANIDEIVALEVKLQKLPRNSSPVRKRNRCGLTGRPRGYYRKFGLGRNMLRKYAMQGDIPGVTKASW